MLERDLWRDAEEGLAPYGPITHADLTRDDTLRGMARRALEDANPSFILVGFSMGGYVAREIIRQDAARVQALILIATSARGDNEVQARRRAAPKGVAGASMFRGLSSSAIAETLHPDNAERVDLIDRIQAMAKRL